MAQIGGSLGVERSRHSANHRIIWTLILALWCLGFSEPVAAYACSGRTGQSPYEAGAIGEGWVEMAAIPLRGIWDGLSTSGSDWSETAVITVRIERALRGDLPRRVSASMMTGGIRLEDGTTRHFVHPGLHDCRQTVEFDPTGRYALVYFTPVVGLLDVLIHPFWRDPDDPSLEQVRARIPPGPTDPRIVENWLGLTVHDWAWVIVGIAGFGLLGFVGWTILRGSPAPSARR